MGGDLLEIDEETAVDEQRGAGDIAGEVGSEEDHNVSYVLRFAETAERDPPVEIGPLLWVGPVVAIDVGFDRAPH